MVKAAKYLEVVAEFETEADRIVKAEVKRRKDQEEAAQRAERARLNSLIPQIEAEIPVVLRLLAKHRYPYREEVQISIWYGSSWIDEYLDYFRKRSDIKAGWKIGEYQNFVLGDTFMVPIYLLSDGHICNGGQVSAKSLWPSHDVEIFVASHGDICLNGLRKLRHKLEMM